MDKFEYLTIEPISRLTNSELDNYGRKGWELVSFTINENFRDYYIFKRKLSSFIEVEEIGNDGNFCNADFDKPKKVIIDSSTIVSKTSVEEFLLPFSGSKTGNMYFIVTFITGKKISILGKYFDSI